VINKKATRRWLFVQQQDWLLNRFDHVFDDLLRITEDHHGFIHVEEFVIKASKNRDLERYKKEQEKLNLHC
jgi:hypothetical protein